MHNIIIQIIFITVAIVITAFLPFLFFQNRKTEYAMRRTLEVLLEPNKVKVFDAKKVIDDVLNDALAKITENFNQMAAQLARQSARAEELEKKLGVQNKMLVSTADASAERIANMTNTLESMVGKFGEILSNDKWNKVEKLSEAFSDNTSRVLKELDAAAHNMNKLTADMAGNIDKWTNSGRKMSDELGQNITNNTNQFNMWAISIKGLGEELDKMSESVIANLDTLKVNAHDMESILSTNDKLLANQLSNLEHWTEQSKKLLTVQINALSDTANQVGTQIRLAESSIENGVDKMEDSAEKLGSMATAMKETFDLIAAEIMNLKARFQSEVDEFSKTVVASLAAAQTATSGTMDNATEIAAAFKESVLPMLANVNSTVQSLEIAKERLQPLSDIMERMEHALPELSEQSGLMTESLTRKISDMAEKINTMTTSASTAISSIGDSTMILEKLSGESRQQMIDLMADYAKAANTMRELTANMEQVREDSEAAAALLQSKEAAPRIIKKTAGASESVEKQIGVITEKLHELSVDLTRSIGAEIPDSVLDKYNAGDRDIFSKWFAKMIKSADKKKVKQMFKSDAVFRHQATLFVQGFAKMLARAERTDDPALIIRTLMKTDLGIMYQSLKACL